MKHYLISLFIFVALPAGAQAPQVELWRLDCGRIQVKDLSMFSDTMDYAGRGSELTNSCYLIRHDDSYMLWDTGFSRDFQNAAVDLSAPSSATFERLIVDQLAELDISPDMIDTVGISHNHFDHMGQAAEFPQARLLIGAQDWDGLRAEAPGFAVDPSLAGPWLDGGRVEPVSDDLDLFGDGTVTLLAMPGHTAGETALLIQLAETGPILLSGDVAHFAEQMQHDRVPPFNDSRAESLASMDRLRDLAAATDATLIIQHDPTDVAKLPAFPKSAR